jgi:hypothetical protein
MLKQGERLDVKTGEKRLMLKQGEKLMLEQWKMLM